MLQIIINYLLCKHYLDIYNNKSQDKDCLRFSKEFIWFIHSPLTEWAEMDRVSNIFENIGNRLFYFLIRYKKTQQKSKINFPQFLRCMYVCVYVCMYALYRSHRLSYGANFFTTISVNTH